MMDRDPEAETIEALLATNEVYLTVTEDTAKAHGVSTSAGIAISTAIARLARSCRSSARSRTGRSSSRGRQS